MEKRERELQPSVDQKKKKATAKRVGLIPIPPKFHHSLTLSLAAAAFRTFPHHLQPKTFNSFHCRRPPPLYPSPSSTAAGHHSLLLRTPALSLSIKVLHQLLSLKPSPAITLPSFSPPSRLAVRFKESAPLIQTQARFINPSFFFHFSSCQPCEKDGRRAHIRRPCCQSCKQLS